MRFGGKWNVRGVRPQARNTAREAARRSGVSVGEWLDNVILERAAAEGLAPGQYPPARHQFPLQDVPYRAGPERYTQPGYAAHGSWPQPYGYGLPPPAPDSLDAAIAEITARQRLLDGDAVPPPSRPAPSPPIFSPSSYPAPHAPPVPPGPPAPMPRQLIPDLSGLEQQLRHITEQLEKLHRPSELEGEVSALRKELAEIGKTLTEALPRREIENLETEVRALAKRVDETRQSGVDPNTVAAMERTVIDLREALRGLTPAEKLSGLDEAINALAHKIDVIAASSQDPAGLQQLEAAITALRSLVSHVASSETLTKLGEEMRGLSAKIERLANSPATAGADAIISLEQRVAALGDLLKVAAMGPLPPQLDALVKTVNEKLDQVELGKSDRVALGHLEDRIVSLVEKLDASDARLSHLGAIERGITDLLVHIDQMRSAGLLGPQKAPPVDALKRDIAQTRTKLEDVHGTLDHVVDRLASIETDMRGAADGAAEKPATPAAPIPAPPAPPKAEAPATAEPAPAAEAAATAPKEAPPPPVLRAVRQPIDPNLPPDYPLEPGSGAPRARATGSPAERIAASEAALGPARTAPPGPAAQTNFIAAARRAAQAAAPSAQASREEAGKGGNEEKAEGKGGLVKRVRSLFVGASAILLLIGSLRVGLDMLDPSSRSSVELAAPKVTSPHAANLPGPAAGGAEDDDDLVPSLIASTPAGEAGSTVRSDITGTVPQSVASAAPKPATSAVGVAPYLPEKLPGLLRNAAVNGDPAAAYEVAMRYVEGRGVAVNFEEAARWLQRAGKDGLAPALFHLGSLFEKGQGVKKDLAAARDHYRAAAEKGNAKAMHNLAVLHAEGIDGKPDYRAAAQWFRRSAERGIADSQYNLGILYARGFGLSQNLAESYKWFALAAAQGDRDAAKKRDEVATRLDQAALTAARLAVQTFVAEPQPPEATTVPTPPGGWERATTPVPARKITATRKSQSSATAPVKIAPQ
jgi:localization factor PodJL